MKPHLISALFVIACGPAPSTQPQPTIKLETGTAALDATVTHVKQGKGKVWCALHVAASPASFPGASPVIGGSLQVEASQTSVKCRFESLPTGTYAISVYQDENSNGVLDTSAFGAPTEGYGASRNNLPAASAPTFDDNKVELTAAQQLTLDISLR